MSEKYTKKIREARPSDDEWLKTHIAHENFKASQFNNLPEEERKRSIRAEHKRNIIPAVVGYGLLASATVGAHEATGNPWHYNPNNNQPAPIEKHGDHRGSTGMPSQEHLDKFAAEHGIKLNQK